MIAEVCMNVGFCISTISNNTFHNAYPFSKILSSPIIYYRPYNFSLAWELNWFIFFIYFFNIFICLKKLSEIQN